MAESYTTLGQKNAKGVEHTPEESHKTAHEALKLAQELQKKMDASALKSLGKSFEDNPASFWLSASTVLLIALLGLATGRMYQKYNNISDAGSIWEFWGEMFTATLCLGIYFWSSVYMLTLGKDIIYYSIFFSALVLTISIFMILVALRTRH
jgi:hypothetical protein